VRDAAGAPTRATTREGRIGTAAIDTAATTT